MKLFFNCSLFEETNFSLNETFVVHQKELFYNKIINNQNVSFNPIDVVYECKWKKQNNWDSDRPTIIIPIKDNIELITKTIKNLYEKNIVKHSNIIIVDDRSTNNIKKIVLDNKLSYLRVDNKKGFNFSMLNNIACYISYVLGCKQAILWNSDLWCVKEEYFLTLLKKHKENNSTISGSKLIYPPIEESMNKSEDSENITSHFPNMQGKWRNTIQFGGSKWINTSTTSPIYISPLHAYRFKDILDNRANSDKGENFVTGALQVLDLNWFINNGGLNPSLSKNFQDVDLCLRAIEQQKLVFYFGKDIYFFHDESVSLMKEGKNDNQLQNDHILFGKIWNQKISQLVF